MTGLSHGVGPELMNNIYYSLAFSIFSVTSRLSPLTTTTLDVSMTL